MKLRVLAGAAIGRDGEVDRAVEGGDRIAGRVPRGHLDRRLDRTVGHGPARLDRERQRGWGSRRRSTATSAPPPPPPPPPAPRPPPGPPPRLPARPEQAA